MWRSGLVVAVWMALLSAAASYHLPASHRVLSCTRVARKLHSSAIDSITPTGTVEPAPMDRFIAELTRACAEESLGQLRLAENRNVESAEGVMHELKAVHCRPIQLKAGLRVQFTYKYKTNDKVQNLETDACAAAVRELLDSGFRSAKLKTLTQDFELTLRRGKGKFRSSRAGEARAVAPVDLQHDRKKQHEVDPAADFLQLLKVTTDSGRPRVGMSDKLRQIQKFVEIVDALYRRSALHTGGGEEEGDTEEGAGERRPMRVMDMGSGSGYLTFATHAHFSRKYQALDVSTVGVELRPQLVSQCLAIARELGTDFNGLSFLEGRIGQGEKEKCDILIALHACDTASDDAIFDGVGRGAEIILLAPCCQKEARPQIESKGGSGSGGTYGDLEGLMQHGIFRERSTEMVTDSMRALLLEIAGYDTQVFEFVGGEHTAKNVMIAAVKRQMQVRGESVEESEAAEEGRRSESRRKLRALAGVYGIVEQHLAGLMGEPLGVPVPVPRVTKLRKLRAL
ncbi:methyltransferase domain-containing protein [Ochromonadaceae sp. CCMP2298]|nr:methyltransferase domain-containing protein [Ochromonadaceae sp. CCMP2298]